MEKGAKIVKKSVVIAFSVFAMLSVFTGCGQEGVPEQEEAFSGAEQTVSDAEE